MLALFKEIVGAVAVLCFLCGISTLALAQDTAGRSLNTHRNSGYLSLKGLLSPPLPLHFKASLILPGLAGMVRQAVSMRLLRRKTATSGSAPRSTSIALMDFDSLCTRWAQAAQHCYPSMYVLLQQI